MEKHGDDRYRGRGEFQITKINPRKIPRSEADVKKAFEDGVSAGVFNASAIFLTVLVDHYGFGDKVAEVWKYICKLSEEVGEHRVSIADLKHVLLTEYDIRI